MTRSYKDKTSSQDNKSCSSTPDSGLFPGKLKSKLSGPFVIKEVRPHGAMELGDPTAGTPEKRWIINEQHLKIYNRGQFERLTSVVYLNIHKMKNNV